MLYFECDYAAGAHPKVLQRLIETNLELTAGYGKDAYTAQAQACIRAACNAADADVFLLTGGTQTNRTVLGAMLLPMEGVLSADTGHIEVHEAGAIESTGHKVLPLPSEVGKVSAKTLDAYLHNFSREASSPHMVQPGMVYLSQPTEYGTLYTRAELQAIYDVCKKAGLKLFLDGARLAYGLAAPDNDIPLSAYCDLCDVFYIGGTKCGLLCGEAVVFPHHGMPKNFFTYVKQQGAMLAKGRVLGVQFETLFTDGLYEQIGQRGIEMAMRVRDLLTEKGYRFAWTSPTNQQFVVVDNETLARICKQVRVDLWECPDDTHTIIRFATSWATRDEDVEALRAIL